ncbi:MAG: DegT/DnrJ/EryC1/StrS aminotransferase family protein [Sedimentisphaerales bacterium]|nr:DegT/DnrJ/EryC1/StrS aminotransferase family protein [Sedimentisphaerales bacterium]
MKSATVKATQKMGGIVEFMPPVKIRDYLSLKKSREISFKNITLTLRGRDSIYLANRHFGLGQDDIALLPGYLCDTVPAAFAPCCNVEYYDIKKDFSIDPAVIENRLTDKRIRVLYVIHYFGFLHKNLVELSKIARKHNVLLFEDHAHSALSHFSYEYADAMIFSFRKVLPVPDGGGLWLKDVVADLNIDRTVLLSDVISMMILAKRKICYTSKRLRNLVGKIIQKDIDALNEGRIQICPRPISHMSRGIIRRADLDSIFRVRREQFSQWQNLLKNTPFQSVFLVLPSNVCPQGFPIWVGNPDKLVSKAEEFDIFLKIHWRSMPDEVRESSPVSWRMSRKIVTLPIYPGLQLDEMERIVNLLVTYGRSTADCGN